MRWDVDTNDPPIRGRADVKILCDGVEVLHVTAFDTGEGWVAERRDHGGELHPDPSNPEEVCRRVLHGRVEVVFPEGSGGE